jgi:hypothetical protein
MGDYTLSSMATYHEVSVFGDNERPTNLKDAPIA